MAAARAGAVPVRAPGRRARGAAPGPGPAGRRTRRRPGPALRELEDDILAQAPHLSAPAARPPRAHPRRPSPRRPARRSALPAAAAPYVGRDAELGQVDTAALEAAAGRPRIVLVTGDAGAGKTALAGQVSQRLAGRGLDGDHRAVPRARGRPGGLALGRSPPAAGPHRPAGRAAAAGRAADRHPGAGRRRGRGAVPAAPGHRPATWRRSAAPRRCWWCSTTCTGPTARRWPSSPTSPRT